MTARTGVWRVLPHRPIEKLAPNLWRVEGDLEQMALKRVMTIAKRSDGALVVHNAMCLEESAMKEIEALGEIRYVVVPNGFHRMDAPAFHARYPQAKILAPRGSRKRVEQKVPVAASFEDYPQDEAVRLEALDGVGNAEGIMVVRSGDAVTLVVNDAVFNMPHASGFSGFMMKHVTQSSGGPRVSRIARLFLIKDKAAFRAELQRLADTPNLARVIVSHHQVIDREPSRVLREVAASL